MLYSFDNHEVQNNPAPALNTGEPTDEQLMEKIQQRDERALEILHQRHRALIRQVVARIISTDADVDDLVQECLLEIWNRAANYNPAKGQALGWLVTLARRRAIDRLRRKSAYWRAQDRFRDESETGSSTAIQCGADEEAAQEDTAAALGRLIAKLPEAQQEAIRLAYFHGMSQREIAAHTGVPLGTIKTRLELAMRKLKSAALAFGELHEPVAMAA